MLKSFNYVYEFSLPQTYKFVYGILPIEILDRTRKLHDREIVQRSYCDYSENEQSGRYKSSRKRYSYEKLVPGPISQALSSTELTIPNACSRFRKLSFGDGTFNKISTVPNVPLPPHN